MTTESSEDRDIAIIGMAGRFPGAEDLDAFWRVISEGRDTISRFEVDDGAEDSDLDAPRDGEQYVRARGVLQGIEDFDAEFFEVNPVEAAQLDPQHRVFLEVAWEALEAAGYAHDRHQQMVSVYAGSFPNTYLHHNLLPDRAAVEEFVRMRRAQSFGLLVQNDPAFLPSRTAYKLNLRGPAINVQTACSTSLVAVALAVQGLSSYESDMAIAGGVCIATPQRTGYFFQEGAIQSRDGTCRPYDANACGTVFGNGAGAVVLKRLADARRDRDPVLAVIRGVAVNNDGHDKVSYFAPSVKGQAEVIATAQALAGIDPGTIGYVEGHGTATPMGDPIEVEALKLAFRQATRKESCCLGSVKGNIGHLDAAAGVAGLIRAVLALRHRRLPATAHFERPNPELRLEDSPFFVNRETGPWPEGPHPRRAGVSSFGIGGTNAHVVLEEAEEAPGDPEGACDPHAPGKTTLLLSARSRAALDAYTGRMAAWVDEQCGGGRGPRPLTEVACALQQRRKLFSHRRAVRVASWADARSALRDPERWDTGTALEGRPKLVMSFPGQGSLHAGAMARPLVEEPGLRGHFEPLARAASELAGFDLLGWATDPSADAEPLRRDNAKAQLGVFCVGVALARWLESRGVRADGFVGHSLGEWVGAHLAGVLTAEDALWAVHRRGQLMQETGPGAALVVRLSERDATPYLQDGVALACVNGPQLCLLSGRPEAIERCAARLAAAGVVSRAAPIDVAVHSPLMDPVVESLRESLRRDLPARRWHAPDRPLLSPVTGRWMLDEEVTSPDYWAAQPRLPVRFDDAVTTLLEEPCCVVLEVGTGDSLSTLVRARLRDPKRQRALPLLGRPRDAAGWAPERLQRGLNELWACGVEVDLLGDLDPGRQAPTLPTYPFQRKRYWKDAPATRRATRQPSADAVRIAPASSAGVAAGAGDLRDQLIAVIHDMSGIAREGLDPSLPFSSLGLDSLFLVQLAETLTTRFALAIGFAQLSEFNTIDKLAAAIGERRARAHRETAAPAPCADTRRGFHGLFPLRRGDGRLPMLLIHGDLGNDLLPPWLPAGQSIYGYAHQGSDGERIRHRSVEAVASRCYSEWMKAEKGAPCILAGHSFGGLVAHHVAHLLRRAGLPVELLILVDAAHPRCFENPFPPGLRRVRRSVRHGIDRAGFIRGIARAELALVRGGRVPITDRSPYLLGLYELAGRRHTPPALDVDALLFRAADSHYEVAGNGWHASDFRQLDVEVAPGDHLSIIRDKEAFKPIAESIARRLEHLRQRRNPRS
jgi:acyl transferase domain-containing protein